MASCTLAKGLIREGMINRLKAAALLCGFLITFTACSGRMSGPNLVNEVSLDTAESAAEINPTIDVCDLSPIEGVIFPRQEPVDAPREVMEAELAGEFGPSEPFIQRIEDIVLQIDETDIPLFLGALKDDIRAEVKESGGKVEGEASGVSHLMQHFSVSYRQDGAFGVINVWGVSGEGTNYYLISDITEYCCSGMEVE